MPGVHVALCDYIQVLGAMQTRSLMQSAMHTPEGLCPAARLHGQLHRLPLTPPSKGPPPSNNPVVGYFPSQQRSSL